MVRHLSLANISVALIAGLVVLVVGCSSLKSSDRNNDAARHFSEEEKHRLYSAALAASDSPMDTKTFEQVCRTIGIFDANGKPNDRYTAFVSQHVAWGTKIESEAFHQEINSKEKAREYIRRHLAAE